MSQAADGQTPERADTVPPPSARESPYSITRDGGIELLGTLTLPASASGRKVPVVLIVAGSGPTDRNGNTPIGGIRPFTYAQLAWGLAEKDIATVRFDKRGLSPSTARLDPTTMSVDDFVGDVTAGIEALSRDTRFSKVIPLGHSEGAMHVVLAANAGAPVAGVAMVSGQGRPMLVVLREQLGRQVDSATLAQFDAAVPKYLRGEDPGQLAPVLLSILVPQYRRFIQGLMAYDPPAEVARAKVPVLIVQGGMDLQITEDDSRILAAASPSAKLVLVPGANHVLKPTTAKDIGGQLESYQDSGLPIAPEIVPAIANWIGALK